MSLETDGVWEGGTWAATVWASNVWREGGVTLYAGDGGRIWPPRIEDPRIQALLDSQSVNWRVYGVGGAVRLALGLSLGLSGTQINNYSVDDMWNLYKDTKGITDTSEPFVLTV